MATMMTVGEYEQAERDVMREEARQGFRAHAIAYALVNLLLVGINLAVVWTTDDNAIWFVFPLVGWGIGLTMHYVFGIRRFDAHVAEWQARIEQRAQQA